MHQWVLEGYASFPLCDSQAMAWEAERLLTRWAPRELPWCSVLWTHWARHTRPGLQCHFRHRIQQPLGTFSHLPCLGGCLQWVLPCVSILSVMLLPQEHTTATTAPRPAATSLMGQSLRSTTAPAACQASFPLTPAALLVRDSDWLRAINIGIWGQTLLHLHL